MTLPRFPAICRDCGALFEAHVVEVVGDITIQEVVIEGNHIERCPRCGSLNAGMLEGTYTVAEDTVEVLAGSGLTRERLQRLSDLLNEARTGEASPSDVAQRLVEDMPALAGFLERYAPTMERALLFFLTTVITILLAQAVAESRDGSATKQDVERALEQAIQQAQPEQTQPAPSAAAKKRPPPPPRKKARQAKKKRRSR